MLHDSQGFEHGEDDTVDTVRKFIKNRNKQDDIKEKLHAIWYVYGMSFQGFHGNLLWQVMHRNSYCWWSLTRNRCRKFSKIEDGK